MVGRLSLALFFAMFASEAAAADATPLTYDASKVGGPNSGAPIEIWRPTSKGPVPVVLILHGCGGLTSHHRSWAARVAEWGWAGAIVDSFGPRRIKSVCNVGGEPTPNTRAQDAYSAAIYLRTPSDILPDSIAVIGFSHGGSTVLQASQAPRVAARSGATPFRAGVAYYPGCGPDPPYVAVATDVLILIGKDDDWTSAANCQKLVLGKKDFEHAPQIKVYPGALHAFDVGGLPQWVYDHYIGGNPEAAADSFKMTRAFLAAHFEQK
jgi:dienelactone hydrolase